MCQCLCAEVGAIHCRLSQLPPPQLQPSENKKKVTSALKPTLSSSSGCSDSCLARCSQSMLEHYTGPVWAPTMFKLDIQEEIKKALSLRDVIQRIKILVF